MRVTKLLTAIAILAVIGNIAIFKMYLGLPYLRLPFAIMVFLYGLNFLSSYSAIMPKVDAMRLQRKVPGMKLSYKNTGTFIIEYFVSLVLLLALISTLLCTMLFRQKEIYEISVWAQIGIAIGGYAISFLFDSIFKIGETYKIGDNVVKPKEKPAATNPEFEEDCAKEAVEVVSKILQEKMGIAPHEIVPSARLADDFGLDASDVAWLFDEYGNYLDKYQGSIYIPEEAMTNAHLKRLHEIAQNYTDITLRYEKVLEQFPCIQDHYNIMKGYIEFYSEESFNDILETFLSKDN